MEWVPCVRIIAIVSHEPAGAGLGKVCVPAVTRVWGAFGRVDPARAAALATSAGSLVPLVESDGVVLHGSATVRRRTDPKGPAWAWAVDGAPRVGDGPWRHAAVGADACGLVLGDDGTVTLHGSVSGIQPLFTEVTAGAVYFATELSWLIDSTAEQRSADWDAWAQILALGAPLTGRTPFAGVSRLGPMEIVELRGDRVSAGSVSWPWLDITPEPGLQPEQLTSDVVDALRARLSDHVAGPLYPMLSGGRDSRLLATLAHHLPERQFPVTAWTTSSDTGTSMEELVASRVAGELGLHHRIVPARHDHFATDVTEYARTVDYLASFHTWLMPVTQQLRRLRGTIVDGIGGGVFLGGGFPDSPIATDVVAARFARLSRYLDAGPEVLAPGATEHIRERVRAAFAPIAAPLADHPQGGTLTAYLTRTAPGIGTAPAQVLGRARTTATPIIADEVVTLALQVLPHRKADGVWYRDLLTAADPRIAALPTAAELTKRRQHVRRGASRQAAEWYRELLVGGPVEELLSAELRTGDAATWEALLNKTRPQHLIRGLALLTLWLTDYRSSLGVPQPDLRGSRTRREPT